MGHSDPQRSYEDLSNIFKAALDRALSGDALPQDCTAFGTNVVLALLDVTHAARHGRSTVGPVMRACGEFATYAADAEAAQRSAAARSRRGSSYVPSDFAEKGKPWPSRSRHND